MNLSSINQQISELILQYTGYVVSEEIIPFILGGSALTILLFIIVLVKLLSSKSKKIEVHNYQGWDNHNYF